VTAIAEQESQSLEGRAAGVATRSASFLIDVLVIAATFALGSAVLERLLDIFLGRAVHVADSQLPANVALVAWAFLYSTYPLAVAGQTLGMAVVGLRVTRPGGDDMSALAAVVRVLVFPLSFLLCGLGFALIVLRRDHRSLHDLIARTCVVYAWKARPARLQFLMRTSAPG
jgi:uncharacterized RDD family membrane protein YckC